MEPPPTTTSRKRRAGQPSHNYKTSAGNFSFYQGQFTSSHTPIESAVAEVSGYANSSHSKSLPPVQPMEARIKYFQPLTEQESKEADEKLQSILGEGMAAARLRLEALKQRKIAENAAGAPQRFLTPDQFLARESKINKRLQSARVAIILKQYRETVIKWLKIRVCRRCRYRYSLMSSIGKWQCLYHPGSIQEGKYSCCGADLHPNFEYSCNGCTKCDHTDRVFHHRGIPVYKIPPLLIDLLHPLPRAVSVRREVSPGSVDVDSLMIDSELGIPNGVIVPILAKKESGEATQDFIDPDVGASIGGAMTDREIFDEAAINTERTEPERSGWNVQSRHKLSEEEFDARELWLGQQRMRVISKDSSTIYYIFTSDFAPFIIG